MEIFNNTTYPKRSKDLKGNEKEFSVDVFSCDTSGVLNIAYWNFDTEKWAFHTDTIVDPYEDGKIMDFTWMYAPKELILSIDKDLNGEY